MKNLLTHNSFGARVIAVALLLMLAATANGQAQTSDAVFAAIEASIKKTDIASLAQHFHTTVEVTIGDNDQDYARKQAQYVVKEFFTNYPVRTFTMMHKGNSGENFYAVGTYVSNRGTFDTNILVRKTGTSYRIHQIRFEKQN